MAKKYFNLSGKAVGKDGNERIVTIVGELSKEREKVDEVTTFKIDDEEFVRTRPLKLKRKTLTYALSICHPDDMDNFDEELAIKIAKKRIKENPMGWLETTSPTNLSKDQIILILFGELKYAIEHIDDFIVKVC